MTFTRIIIKHSIISHLILLLIMIHFTHTQPSKIIEIQDDDEIEIITGHRQNEKPDKMQLGNYPINPYLVRYPSWRASATFASGDKIENGPSGEIIFRQFNPGEIVTVTINATGLPAGKHAVHIHAFGDLSDGCKSTGPHMRNMLVGNINVKEEGTIDISFHSPYVNIFGPKGVIGRSVAIHEKPIVYHRFPDIYGIPNGIHTVNPVTYQTEEMIVGGMVACGIITITDNIVH